MITTRLVLLAGFVFAAGPLIAAAPPAPAARIIHVSGDVTIGSNTGGRLAKKDAVLAVDDSVTTSAGAVAVIELPDGSRLKLRESS
ncbi:MAG: hypothetical protein ABL955_13095, partial [Elusimicrobiota bacterium]